MSQKKAGEFERITDHPLFKNTKTDEHGRPIVWRNEYYCRGCQGAWDDEASAIENQECSSCGGGEDVEIYVSRWIGPKDGEEVWRHFQSLTRRRVCTYVVIENCGYANETEAYQDESLIAVEAWIRRIYGRDEREEMHVQIACDYPDGSRSYEY